MSFLNFLFLLSFPFQLLVDAFYWFNLKIMHQAFSLDFNLRAHMKTHVVENYHLCPYSGCGKRYTNELKLRTHMKSHHEKVLGTFSFLIYI